MAATDILQTSAVSSTTNPQQTRPGAIKAGSRAKPKVVTLCKTRGYKCDRWHIVGTYITIEVPTREPVSEVKAFISRKICDNPAWQHELGLLDAESFKFRVVKGLSL